MYKAELKKRGWTDTQITRFLGQPDWRTVNPMYKSAAPVCHYDDTRVAAVEASAAFRAAQERGKGRRAGAIQSVETKRRKTEAFLAALVIKVPKLLGHDLVWLACESYNARSDEGRASPNSDPLFLDRIKVNYLRHELSNYENDLAEIVGKVGARDAALTIKERVLDAISDVYPALADECERQIRRTYESLCC